MQSDRPKEPKDTGLDPELEQTLKRVGPDNYGKETASDFAKGGRFNKNRRPRYALR